MGCQPELDCVGAVPPVVSVLSVGLAIGKYFHNFLQCGLPPWKPVQTELAKPPSLALSYDEWEKLCVSPSSWRAQLRGRGWLLA